MPQLWFRSALLPGGWARDVRLTVEAGRIAAVAAGVAPEAADERHGIAVPGLSNLHSHAFQRGMAGLAETRGPERDTFWTWREVMYRFLDRLTPEDNEAVAAMAYAEMLEAGFTRVGEFHYLHNDRDGTPYAEPAEMAFRIAAAAQATGIALTLLPVFYAHGGFGPRPAVHGQRRFLGSRDGFARLVEGGRRAVAVLDGAVVGIAPHSLRAATLDDIAAILPLAAGGPVHIHAAEQVLEVEECVAALGTRPVETLLDGAPVDSRWCLIHATHLTPDETRRLAQSGAVAGLCPVTEGNLGDGIFPLEAYAEAGGRFGIGTDSNVLIGAADELRMMEYAQRLSLRRRNVLTGPASPSTGRALFDAALAGGAQALGVPAGLEAGAAADLVALDPDHPALVERDGDALLDGWIFAARSSPVLAVWRAGRPVVAGGRHVDHAGITARYRATLARLLA
ncbi:formimidoylglutamate deiminase [Methylobacterium oryzihabitans]|uniref:Formimidoylglutamate deiminase n=1 Tax=Methylobacterium oryzihabitans TaxID=2499852 RepID=A0A3S3UCQ5_9HYPH|nr:formimidoylglutamate deiminase [Methylobacterium oryzihabitans]RVU21024.1 formimidoylglutamate deiminase [Methylobacterium oryzihabitans]